MDTNEKLRLEQEMIAGYIATRDDRRVLNRDWQIVDGESRPAWDVEEPTASHGGLLDAEDRAARLERQ